MVKNEKNKNKNFWEWRCFYKQEKIEGEIIKNINFNLPSSSFKKYIDQYIILPNSSHNIKLRKTNNKKVRKLQIKTIMENKKNIYKFSTKTTVSLPITQKSLKKLNLQESDEDVSVIIKHINLEDNKRQFTEIKKEITRYKIEENISNFDQKIRLEFANVKINTLLSKTFSIKCSSLETIKEILQSLNMHDLKGTNYIDYIKSLGKL